MSRRESDAPRVLIMGGAEGTGFACAHVLAARGAELILADCDGTALTRAAESVGALSRYCDAIGPTSVEVFVQELTGVIPSIDVLINAAGRGYVRALAMTRVTHALLPLLRRSEGRRLIINIASAGGFAASNSIFPYASSHEAFDKLSNALKEQMRGTGIDVVSVAPALSRGGTANSFWSDQLYALQRVDELETATRVRALVEAARGDWRRPSPPSASLRA